MKAPLLIVAVVLLMAGSGLAIMNNACKSGDHTWCAPFSSIQHHDENKLRNRLRLPLPTPPSEKAATADIS
jgi:hypothetical protein